jgi:hypothetical protein
MNEAQATHSGMLHQSRTLWAKGMRGETVEARTLSLNDFIAPGEVTITQFTGEGVIP